MTETVLSARAVPEDAGQTSSPVANGLKRRPSDALEQEQDSKRKRTRPGKNSPGREDEEINGEQSSPRVGATPAATQKEEHKEIRRKGGVGDEKQRSKRLFGALLGDLNQPGDRVSKRRTEIEQRRKAELQKQDDERLEDRQRRLEVLATHRKKEQINVEERNMHIRHKHALATANFLCTKAEPKLYYRPWELLPDEEDRIDEQVKDAQSQIDKEVSEWEEEKLRRLQELGDSITNGATAPTAKSDSAHALNGNNATTSEPTAVVADGAEANTSPDISGDLPEYEASAAPDTGSSQVVDAREAGEEQVTRQDAEPLDEKMQDRISEEAKEEPDDEEGHVVEGDEDTVIY